MKCEKNFMVRVPYNSYDYYINHLKKKVDFDLEEFKEHLFISSPSLYNMVLNNKELNEDIDKSIVKYLIRSATRCTPYGLTSGVVSGCFSDKNNLIIEDEFVKKVRPDMSWLVNVVKILEKELGIKLNVIKNNTFLIKGNKLVKSWNSCYLKKSIQKDRKIYINKTNAVEFVFQLASKYISISDIIEQIKLNCPEISEKEIMSFIEVLIDNEYLLSDLRTNTLITNPLEYLLNKLKDYNHNSKTVEKLQELKKLLVTYEKIKVGNGECQCEKIVTLMNRIYTATNYLQVDMYNISKLSLSIEMKYEIEEFANFLTNYQFNETYQNYALRIKEKYGNQAVKYIDLIDEESGLGTPMSDDKNSLKYNDYIICKIIKTLIENRNKEINLEEYFTEVKDVYNKTIQTDGELAFYLIEENNQQKYVISPLMGSNTKFKINGRFAYIFPNINNQSSKTNVKEIEVCFTPENGRYYNVMMCKTDKKAYLEYGTNIHIKDKERIDLEDIYVIVDNNNYIRFIQKSTNEVVEFYASNMFNIASYPKELQILIELTNKQKKLFTSFFTTLLHYVMQIEGYVPRINYKNFIVFPASYLCDCNLQFKDKKSEIEILHNYIKLKQKEYEFSSLISVGPMDQKLLLNVDNHVHLNILYDLLKKDNKLRIYENVFDSNNLVVSNKKGNKYISEFIISLSSEQNYDIKRVKVPSQISYLERKLYLQHSILPFENWLSIKLYTWEELQDYIIINYIHKINKEIKNKYADGYLFYIRYKDSKSHLRLRIKYNLQNLENIINMIRKMAIEMKEKSLLTDFVIDTYYPEFERYGGDMVYDKVERFFSIDSELVINLLKLKEYKLTKLSSVELFIITTYKVISDLNLDSEEVLYYLNDYNIGKKYNKDFDNLRNRISDYIDKNNCWEKLRSTEEGIRILVYLDKYAFDFKELWKSINIKFQSNIERKKGILLSLIHMHYNRMIGLNRSLENRIMGYLRKIIYIEVMKDKYNGSEKGHS